MHNSSRRKGPPSFYHAKEMPLAVLNYCLFTITTFTDLNIGSLFFKDKESLPSEYTPRHAKGNSNISAFKERAKFAGTECFFPRYIPRYTHTRVYS